MRATLLLLTILSALTTPAPAQVPLEVGSPETAFAGGPIKLSKNALGTLRAHYQGDKVPLVPQPLRGRLDAALTGRDWPRVDALKKELIARDGIIAALAWEQSRFIATGSIGVAEIHALDVAAAGSTGLSETAVMLWFYAVGVTMTDGHKCVDAAAKEAHLDKLRGPAFEPVTRLVRSISDDRLAAMRDLAIRLETALAPDRNDDLMCRVGNGAADVKPDPAWRSEVAMTRGMLPRHLMALASVMRPRPIARPEPPKPDIAKPAAAKPDAAPHAQETVIAPVLPLPALALPLPDAAPATAPDSKEPTSPSPTKSDTVAAPPPNAIPPKAGQAAPPGGAQPATEAGKVATPPDPAPPELINPRIGKPNPSRFEPPNLELAPVEPPARH